MKLALVGLSILKSFLYSFLDGTWAFARTSTRQPIAASTATTAFGTAARITTRRSWQTDLIFTTEKILWTTMKSLDQLIQRYCLLVRYSFIFDSFGASRAVYRNLWYINSPRWEEICLLLGNNLTARFKQIYNEQVA